MEKKLTDGVYSIKLIFLKKLLLTSKIERRHCNFVRSILHILAHLNPILRYLD